MGYLQGLREYLDEKYRKSTFDDMLTSQRLFEMHVYGHGVIRARAIEDQVYDIKLDIENQGEEILPKLHIQFLYPADQADTVRPLLKVDKKLKARNLEPQIDHRERQYIKNKTLFPLMKEREVLFFTLLGGDVLRGLVLDFSLFEITMGMKGGIPVTIMRHALYDVRDKKGTCYLRSVQDGQKLWQKTSLWVPEPGDQITA